MIPTRRLALAAGDGSGPTALDALSQLLGELVRRTEARAALIVDAYGQIPALFNADANESAVLNVSFLQSTHQVASDLLSGQAVWFENGRVHAHICGGLAVLFVVEPARPAFYVANLVVDTAERVAVALATMNPDAEALTPSISRISSASSATKAAARPTHR